MKKTLIGLTSLLMVLAILMTGLVGCVSGSGTAPEATAGVEGNDGADATEAVSDTPKKTELVVVTSTEPVYFNNLCPSMTNLPDTLVYSQIYDPLFYKDWNDGGKVKPYLAENYEMSEDGLQIKVKLRDNVYFHNGYKLTSEDVKFTFDEMATRTLGKALLINWDSVEIIDDLNLIFHLKAPYGAIMNALCSRLDYISCKKYWDEVGGFDGYNANPIGTGPYKFVSALSGNEVVMERNDNYWNGAAAFEKCIVKTVSDTNTAVLAVENGDADVALNLPLESLINLDDPAVNWNYDMSFEFGYLQYNFAPDSWVGNDTNFRKAVQYGINKDAVNEVVFYGKSNTPDILGDETWTGRPLAGTYETYSYDVEKAKEYLAASNYKGQEFRVYTWANTNLDKAAQVIQASLQEIGINMKVTAVDRASFWDIVRGTKDWDACLHCLGASSLDMDGYNHFMMSMYPQYFNKDQVLPNGQAMSDLVMAGRLEPNEAKRIEIYTQLVNYINEEAISIPVYQEINTALYNKDLKNVTADRAVPVNRFFNYTY
ncbi:MAG: ABC transporter substrate-binding protein [Christensenella sp.]